MDWRLGFAMTYIERKVKVEKVKVRFGWVQVLILVAGLTTALIHLYLNFLGGFDIMFTLNGLGYLGLLSLLFLPISFVRPFHPVVRWVTMGYALLTIVLWFVLNGRMDVYGYTAKLAEVALIVLLFLDRSKK
jgi:hypothetical protein